MAEQIFSSTILILAVVALRAVLGNHISQRLKYSLWILVAIRLLIPVPLFYSSYSVAAIAEIVTDRAAAIAESAADRVTAAWEQTDVTLEESENEVYSAAGGQTGDAVWLGQTQTADMDGEPGGEVQTAVKTQRAIFGFFGYGWQGRYCVQGLLS